MQSVAQLAKAAGLASRTTATATKRATRRAGLRMRISFKVQKE